MSKHNEKTNYATWRVNREMMDGLDWEDVTPETDALKLSEQLRGSVLSFIEESCDVDITIGWAKAFVENVNFFEIAEHIIAKRKSAGS